jgi:hypothetical protein
MIINVVPYIGQRLLHQLGNYYPFKKASAPIG